MLRSVSGDKLARPTGGPRIARNSREIRILVRRVGFYPITATPTHIHYGAGGTRGLFLTFGYQPFDDTDEPIGGAA